MMKKPKSILVLFLFAAFTVQLFSQGGTTLNTRVADILALMPARDARTTGELLNSIIVLGEPGLRLVCEKVIPPGSGDDTKARFAVESISRSVSAGNDEKMRLVWEAVCIGFAESATDYNVKDFFMKQLQLAGGDQSVKAVKKWLSDSDLCAPAVAVISTVKSKYSDQVLAEAIADRKLPCAAAVLNELAFRKASEPVEHYIYWAGSPVKAEKSAALNALAFTGKKEAMLVLLGEAAAAKYRWENTGAVASLLVYADVLGAGGNISDAEKIAVTLIEKCTGKDNLQYKIAALGVLVKYNGEKSFKYLTEAARSADNDYRKEALKLSVVLKNPSVTEAWLKFWKSAPAYSRADLIGMFGNRRDLAAANLVKASLDDSDPEVRSEALQSIIALYGDKAFNDIIRYPLRHSSPADLESWKVAIRQVTGKEKLPDLLLLLKEAPSPVAVTVIDILAETGDNRFFQPVLEYSRSKDPLVREAALKALKSLASASDIKVLVNTLLAENDASAISYLQSAAIAAVSKSANPGGEASELIMLLAGEETSLKLIPVLGRTGSNDALNRISEEFDSGNNLVKDASFSALLSWPAKEVLPKLLTVIVSGDKDYQARAFAGFIKILSKLEITDDQKVLYCRAVMPYAANAQNKKDLLNLLSSLKTYQSFFFTANFLDDPLTAPEAAKAVMLIALPSSDSGNGFSGTAVRSVLTKAMTLLSGPESDYEKELIRKYLDGMSGEEGFVKIFNGRDLECWHGLVENPVARGKMKPAELARKQAEADKKMLENWSVRDGLIWFSGKGDNICTVKKYGDFEMLVDWKITKKGDSGIYLRGSPQVQIWDTSRTEVGAQVGSGGLYNNQKNISKPLVVADNPVGDWNSFRILMIGEKVSVWLNGILVTDNTVMENYWDRSLPIFDKEAIELQAHGTDLAFRDIYVREINEKNYGLSEDEVNDGFVSLFNGRNLDNWTGDKTSYTVDNSVIVIQPSKGSGGNLFTEKEYSDFIFRFEFQLSPAANNGLGIRAPLEGDAAYVGMELQILDDNAGVYSALQPYQYHGSVYGVIPSKRGYLKPVGEWNYQEVIASGTAIKVTLNGTVIIDGDIKEASVNGTADHREHPGLLNKKGHIGFLGHGSVVKFRNIRIKELKK